MKIDNTPAYAVEDNNPKMAVAKVSIFNVGHAMRIFARSTYTRPIEAVVRENIANAQDASKGKKFEVTAPSLLDPNFKVRDYGVGMDEAFFMDGYAKVGYSTKRESNDEIGGFGQGRFAAFAYEPCDQFYVRGVKDGKWFLGSVWHDANFEIFVQVENRGESDEPNGVEIIIPVEVKDHRAFYSAIQIFTEFLPQVETDVERLERPALFEGKNKDWKITQFIDYDTHVNVVGPDVRAVMGGVPYKLDLSQVYGSYRQSEYLNISKADLIFNIGDLSIPASREELHYDEQTKKAVKAKIDEIKAELKAEVEARKQKLKTDWERWTDPGIGAYERAFGNNSSSKNIRTDTLKNVDLCQTFVKVREFQCRSSTKQTAFTVSSKEQYLIYVADVKFWRGRIGLDASNKIDALYTAASSTGQRSPKGIVLVVGNEQVIKDHLGDAPYIKASTLPDPPKVPRQAGVKAATQPRIVEAATWNKKTFSWVYGKVDLTVPNKVYVPAKIRLIKEDYNWVWEVVRNTKEAQEMILLPESLVAEATKAGWKDIDTYLKELLTPEALEGFALIQAWPESERYHFGTKSVHSYLAELVWLLDNGFKLPKSYSSLENRVVKVGKVFETDDDDLRSKFKRLAEHYKIPLPKAASDPIKVDFQSFLDKYPVFSGLLGQQAFSSLSPKVDTPTILGVAKKVFY